MSDEKHDPGSHATMVNPRYAFVIMVLAVSICLATVFGVRYQMQHGEVQLAAHHASN